MHVDRVGIALTLAVIAWGGSIPRSADAADRGTPAATAPAEQARFYPPAWLKPGAELVFRSGEVEIDKPDTKAWEYDAGDVDRDALDGWAFMRVQHASPTAVTVYAEAARWGGPAKGFLTFRWDSKSFTPDEARLAYLRPDRFEAFENKTGPDDSVGEMKWTIGGKAYEALAFSSGDVQLVFDRASGITLEFGQRLGDGGAAGKAKMRVVQLAHFRQTGLPWTGQPTPDWVKPGLTLRYRQTRWTRPPGKDAKPADVERGTLSLTVDRVEPAGVAATAETATGPTEGRGAKPPKTEPKTITPDDRYWVHPDVLAGLKPGQVLDECPVRRQVIKVKRVDRAEAGGGTVTLETRSRNQVVTETFDLSSGALFDRVRFDRPIDQYDRLRFVAIDQPEDQPEAAEEPSS